MQQIIQKRTSSSTTGSNMGLMCNKHAHGRIAQVGPIAARACKPVRKRWSTPASSFYLTACKHITNAHARSTGKTAIATGANCAPARSNDFERSIRRGPTCACKRNKGTHVRNSEHAPHINYVCKRQRTTCNLPTHRRRDADSAIGTKCKPSRPRHPRRASTLSPARRTQFAT